MEATLALVEEGLALAIQDMGAAGLTSSSVEMASRGGAGVHIDVAHIPSREPGMTPYEYLLSESQERMLAVVRPEELPRVKALVGERWELCCEAIGEVTEDGRFRVSQGDEIHVDLPVDMLTTNAPVYRRPVKAPDTKAKAYELPRGEERLWALNRSVKELCLDVLSLPSICSKAEVFQQFDSHVGLRTVHGSGEATAAIMRCHESGVAWAMSVDCASHRVKVDPYLGTIYAALECVRNLTCAGARPLALTDCLNFGDPTDPEVMWQFKRAIEGLNAVAQVFDVPVISGNVSLYNASQGEHIFPTPTLAMVGVYDDMPEHVPCVELGKRGNHLVVVSSREHEPSLHSSELVYGLTGDLCEGLDVIDLKRELLFYDTLRDVVDRLAPDGIQDCSEGGIFVALAEMMCGSRGEVGVRLNRELDDRALVRWLFSEVSGQVVISCHDGCLNALDALFAQRGLPAPEVIGEVIDEAYFEVPCAGLMLTLDEVLSRYEGQLFRG